MSLASVILMPLRACRHSIRQKLNSKCRYTFHDRRKHSSTLVIILAGYKPFLWDDVLQRIRLFAPSDADICIVSSGKYDHFLDETAEQNSWSYLSIRRNCVELALNVAILLHTKAEFIYKIDEDIFVTQHSFDVLMSTYHKVLQDGLYEPAFIAPLIPINAYAHIRVLEKLGLLDVYERKFEKVKYFTGRTRMIETSPRRRKVLLG